MAAEASPRREAADVADKKKDEKKALTGLDLAKHAFTGAFVVLICAILGFALLPYIMKHAERSSAPLVRRCRLTMTIDPAHDHRSEEMKKDFPSTIMVDRVFTRTVNIFVMDHVKGVAENHTTATSVDGIHYFGRYEGRYRGKNGGMEYERGTIELTFSPDGQVARGTTTEDGTGTQCKIDILVL